MAKKMSSFRLSETTSDILKRVSEATGKDQTAVLEEAVRFYDAEHSEPWLMTPARLEAVHQAMDSFWYVISRNPTHKEASRAADLIARAIDKP